MKSATLAPPPGSARRILVWDWPTRMFHWAIVICFTLSWWSVENHEMEWHYRAGMAALALLVFRIAWGFVGTSTARFATFISGPRRVLAYARTLPMRKPGQTAGHNPLGGWSVIALLALMLGQVGLGLFAVDTDGLESGPLSWLVEFENGRRAAQWHGLIFNVLVALIAVHVGAVLFYLLFKRDNLILPMIGGHKRVTDEALRPARKGALLALVVAILLALGTTLAVWNGLPFLG